MTVKTLLMALLEDINNIIPKKEFSFDLGFIGDATSNFAIDRLFKLNYAETIECTNM